MGSASSSQIKKTIERQLTAVPIYPPPGATAIRTQSRKPTKPVPQHSQKTKLDTQTSILTNEGASFSVDGERSQVFEAPEWPHSVHGIITAEMNKNMTCGTGIMIGPNIVLTVGHNLYDLDTKTFANVKTLQFLPGINGQMLPSGVGKVERYFVSPNYIKNGKQDYGILILQKPIGQMTGYFGLACLDSPEEMKAKPINVTGYPNDKKIETSNDRKTWRMEPEAYEIDQETGHIKYPIETGEGQNGSGVWYQEGEDYYVCGIHRGAQSVGLATLLTRDIYKQIYSWLQEVGFKESMLRLKDRKELYFYDLQSNLYFFSLLNSYKLDDLETLNFSGGINGKNVVCKAIQKLGQNTSWINLSRLTLRSICFDAEGARALAENISWTKLKYLDLCDSNLGVEEARALAKNTSWINLTELNVAGNKLGAEGATLLAQNTSWKNLSKFVGAYMQLGCKGAKGLAQNASWINLSHLVLKCNGIQREGAKALAENTSWVNLSLLDLSTNNITEEGARELANNKSWIKLSHLDLSSNGIGPAGGRGLAGNTSWINLSDLNLACNRLGYEGAKGLAENRSWINLSNINFRHNESDVDWTTAALMGNKVWKRKITITTYEMPPPPVEEPDS